MSSPSLPHPAATDDWRILDVLGPYRLLLVAVVLTLHGSGYAPQLVADVDAATLYAGCLLYTASTLTLLALGRLRRPGLQAQASLHLMTDLTTIGALIANTHGVNGGYAVLLAVPVIATSLVSGPRIATARAALASIVVLGVESLVQWHAGAWNSDALSRAGLTGLMLLASSLVANMVAQRARRSAAVASEVGSRYSNLARLSERIVGSLHAGVLLVDGDGVIRMSNPAASRLAGRRLSVGSPLAQALPELHAAWQRWLRHSDVADDDMLDEVAAGSTTLAVRFVSGPDASASPPPPSPLTSSSPPSGARETLITLEDALALRQQTQQIKLAALGRLTGGIAHEIRNPLSAIIQASQLLGESGCAAQRERRLLDIIQRHASRIEQLVGDVLDVGRVGPGQRQALRLAQWLPATIALYQETHPGVPRDIRLHVEPADLAIEFDPAQLRQVLFNLWDNSHTHAVDASGEVGVQVDATLDGEWVRLRICDNGRGIPAELADRVFEPFFTTSAQGTGLGLYLARELCVQNGATLRHLRLDHGTCFAIDCQSAERYADERSAKPSHTGDFTP